MVPTLPGAPAVNGHTDTSRCRTSLAGSARRSASPSLRRAITSRSAGRARSSSLFASGRSRSRNMRLLASTTLSSSHCQPMIVGMMSKAAYRSATLTLEEMSRRAGYSEQVARWGARPRAAAQGLCRGGRSAHLWRNRGPSLLVAGDPKRSAFKTSRKSCPLRHRVVMRRAKPSRPPPSVHRRTERFGRQRGRKSIPRTRDGYLSGPSGDPAPRCARRSPAAVPMRIISRHHARYFAATYPQLCQMVTVSEAEKFSSTIAMTSAVDPLRGQAAKAFSDFFFSIAREVYPRYGFASIGEAEFGQTIRLEK